jgi:hypothetical protein
MFLFFEQVLFPLLWNLLKIGLILGFIDGLLESILMMFYFRILRFIGLVMRFCHQLDLSNVKFVQLISYHNLKLSLKIPPNQLPTSKCHDCNQ